ncbi:MAG TPA: hypothetical protein VM260_17725 [Pirellula sp.]|nr:hypothetical protein [Pirellula sp.]
MVLSRKVSLAIGSLIVLASTADVLIAQQRGGGGGRGQTARARFELATLPEVQADLKLNDEQKKVATDLFAKQQERRAAAGGGGGADFAALVAERAKQNAEADATFVAKLDDKQKSRLNGLIAQVNGAASLLDPAISAALQLTQDVLSKLKSVNDANGAARREAMGGLQGKSQEEITEMMSKLREKEDSALLAVVSDDQKKKYEELKGAKLTIDQTSLRGNRGGNRKGGNRN